MQKGESGEKKAFLVGLVFKKRQRGMRGNVELFKLVKGTHDDVGLEGGNKLSYKLPDAAA